MLPITMVLTVRATATGYLGHLTYVNKRSISFFSQVQEILNSSKQAQHYPLVCEMGRGGARRALVTQPVG